MQLKIYQIDAFAEKVFTGNPAAVVPLKSWLPAKMMQNIAMENNLSETAFFMPTEKGFHIRWFTPVSEVNLCGHATLATAHVLFNHLGYPKNDIVFESRSGMLKVKKLDDLIALDFPVSEHTEIPVPENSFKVLGIAPEQCILGKEDLMFVFPSEKDISNLKPDFEAMKNWDCRGIIATANSAEYDFVSRFFAPIEGINEDPVTGSAHTVLIPFWANELGKTELTAKQISKRGGILHCKHLNQRVEIAGKAVTFLIGEIT